MGVLQLIIGPMWAGKTTEMLRRVKRYIQYKNIIIKYDDGSEGRTHANTPYKTVFTRLLKDVDITPYKVIGIDEGQFFKDLLPFCMEAILLDKIIIVAGLDGDYLQRPFGDILQLIPICDSVVKLLAVCVGCFNPACFSKRTCGGDKLIISGEQYIPVCRKCINMDLSL